MIEHTSFCDLDKIEASQKKMTKKTTKIENFATYTPISAHYMFFSVT